MCKQKFLLLHMLLHNSKCACAVISAEPCCKHVLPTAVAEEQWVSVTLQSPTSTCMSTAHKQNTAAVHPCLAAEHSALQHIVISQFLLVADLHAMLQPSLCEVKFGMVYKVLTLHSKSSFVLTGSFGPCAVLPAEWQPS